MEVSACGVMARACHACSHMATDLTAGTPTGSDAGAGREEHESEPDQHGRGQQGAHGVQQPVSLVLLQGQRHGSQPLLQPDRLLVQPTTNVALVPDGTHGCLTTPTWPRAPPE